MNSESACNRYKWRIEHCFPVVLFIMLYKVVLTFESVYEILKCNVQQILNLNQFAKSTKAKFQSYEIMTTTYNDSTRNILASSL